MGKDESEIPLTTRSSSLPVISEEEAKKNAGKMSGMLVGLMMMPRIIGAGIAFGLSKIPGAQEKDVSVQPYLLLSVYVFNMCATWLNVYPMIHKAKIMEGGNLRANMYIFKDNQSLSHVTLDEEGDVGKYNRANRSLHHFVENAMGFCAAVLLVGPLFPKPVFVLTVLFAMGRILHQQGYTNGYGGHGAGFGLALLASATLDGFLMVTAVQEFLK
eukprot:gnl/MRDRNA2_/MRDRNA2_119304_c0_seq1.p1 gnl/MRDRNA2_/MRDRNA2_119304_c0~~gnl/MRDRNA2_/MRDRNA2_119304_c0_seq1.p1  ORF type:complete len:215 (+),score=34.31 gnl/MRDRNA2_/MRDRNA2_119304_c0_seq1:77-721(+)